MFQSLDDVVVKIRQIVRFVRRNSVRIVYWNDIASKLHLQAALAGKAFIAGPIHKYTYVDTFEREFVFLAIPCEGGFELWMRESNGRIGIFQVET